MRVARACALVAIALLLAPVAAMAEPLPVPDAPQPPLGDRWRGWTTLVAEWSGPNYRYRRSARLVTTGPPSSSDPDMEAYPAAGAVNHEQSSVQVAPPPGCSLTTTVSGTPAITGGIAVGRVSIIGGEIETGFPHLDVPGRYVVYWFFYGRNSHDVGPWNDLHEGDWERVAVRLDRHNRATHVAYWQHYCSPSRKHGSLLTWGEMLARGHVVDDVHPRVYVARGAHATYPRKGKTRFPCKDPKKGGLDDHQGGDVRWRTWQDGRSGFEDVVRKPWYGFGGGWGSRTAKGGNAFWGPLGPGPKKPPVPQAWR